VLKWHPALMQYSKPDAPLSGENTTAPQAKQLGLFSLGIGIFLLRNYG
jgi:hypothetical protein